MHEEMEDEISVSPKRRRGRPARKKMRLEPTESESKTIIVESKVDDVDLNANFDMDDAKEPEERN